MFFVVFVFVALSYQYDNTVLVIRIWKYHVFSILKNNLMSFLNI